MRGLLDSRGVGDPGRLGEHRECVVGFSILMTRVTEPDERGRRDVKRSVVCVDTLEEAEQVLTECVGRRDLAILYDEAGEVRGGVRDAESSRPYWWVDVGWRDRALSKKSGLSGPK